MTCFACRLSRCIGILSVAVVIAGCAFGPQALAKNRLDYNEAVKTTTEEQLLLNIVRLRYTDTPSSLAVTTIAAQFERGREAAIACANDHHIGLGRRVL